MMSFNQFQSLDEEARMKRMGGVEIPVPSKPTATNKLEPLLKPPAAPKPQPLTFDQALRKSAEISAFAKVAAEQLKQSAARRAAEEERKKAEKEAREPVRPDVPVQGF